MAHPIRKLADAAPHPRNPRTIAEDALARLGESMERYGDISALVLNRQTGRIVGGHQRTKHLDPEAEVWLLREFDPPTERGTVGVGSIDVDGEPWLVRIVDVDETTELAMNVAANAHGGEWDERTLAGVLAELREEDPDLGAVGFDEATAADLIELLTAKPLVPDPDAVFGNGAGLASERLIEVRCTDAFLREISETIEAWAEREGVDVAVS